MDELEVLANKIPGHLVIQKRLWLGNQYVDIDHIDNDINKPLDYVAAFKKMIEKTEASQ